ncbi:MAG: FAD-dependent oxidoreductase [Armatimonadetes bacterium]|nr:FAD-dependent oxidoreductase [Armatimonadota bacterium]
MATGYDILIIGGGTGGTAAALAAARAGRRVLMTEETDWIGGQLTAQAVPPDENPWIETFGGTRSYRAFREGVRDYYRRHFPLTPSARANPLLNPGDGFVSRLCHEPRVALAVLEALLAPYLSNGQVTILLRHIPVAAQTQGDRVQGVTVRSLETGREHEFRAPYTLDATETGALLPLVGVEYMVGAESRAQTGEPHALDGPAQPGNQQGVTHCFALSYHPGEDHTIEPPAQYDFWRNYQAPFWPGPHLGWTDLHPTTLEPRTFSLFGPSDDPGQFMTRDQFVWGQQGLWHYRRLRHCANFAPPPPILGEPEDRGRDISLVNWPQNDYWLAPVIDVPPEDEARAREAAKQLSLSLLYWLQTEAPHPDGDARGYPGLKLRPDVVGTEDSLAKSLYVRESRRIRAEMTVCEQHISSALRDHAEVFPDSVGIGCYRIDLHPSTGGDNYIDIGCCPFQIPLGALLPVRVENLLPAAKNLGVTHITNGAYRLHPVEWAIGEAAGSLAAFCLDTHTPPRAVRADPTRLADFQARLRAQGVPTEWPSVYPI